MLCWIAGFAVEIWLHEQIWAHQKQSNTTSTTASRTPKDLTFVDFL